MPPLSVTSPLLGTCPTCTSLKHEIWRRERWQVCQSKLLSQIHLLPSVVLAVAAQPGIAEAISPGSQDTAKNCSLGEMWDCRHWRLRWRELASRTEELLRYRMPHTVVLQAIRGAQSTRKNMSCAAEEHCTRLEHSCKCRCSDPHMTAEEVLPLISEG